MGASSLRFFAYGRQDPIAEDSLNLHAPVRLPLTRWNSELFREIPVLDPDTIDWTLPSAVVALLRLLAHGKS